MQYKRKLLLGVLAALLAIAALGVWVLLFEDFFGIEGQVFATLGTVVLFGLPGMLAAYVAERGRWRIVMAIEGVVCLIGAAVFLFVIWIEPSWDHRELWTRAMGTATVWAIALPWAGGLALYNFAQPFNRNIRKTSIGLVLGSAALIWLLIMSQFPAESGKLVGVTLIFSVLGTIVLPMLKRLEKIDKVVEAESVAMSLELTCPRCLLRQSVASGWSRCKGCRLKFHIEIEEPRCPQCNYLLHRLVKPQCPECGAALSDDEVMPQAKATDSENACEPAPSQAP